MGIPSNLYLPQYSITVPKNNDAVLTFPVRDNAGDLVDISGFTEIEFTVWNKHPTEGGTVQFQKKLSTATVTIGGDDASAVITVTKAQSGAITGRLGYYELEMTDASGNTRTVAAGIFRSENTYTAFVA